MTRWFFKLPLIRRIKYQKIRMAPNVSVWVPKKLIREWPTMETLAKVQPMPRYLVDRFFDWEKS